MGRLWSAEDDVTLRSLAGSVPATQIAAQLNRTVDSIQTRLWQMHLGGLPRGGMAAWTTLELKLLREQAPFKTATQIAAVLGRTGRAVQAMANRQGLQVITRKGQRFASTPHFWSEKDVQTLRDHHLHKTVIEIAAMLGRTEFATGNKMNLIGLPTRGNPMRPKRGLAPKVQVAKPAPKPVVPPSVQLPAKKEVARISWCPVCCAPVVNTWEGWSAHNARVGCNKKAQRAT